MTDKPSDTRLATVESGHRKKSRRLIIVLAALGAATAITAAACGGHRGHMNEKMVQRVVLGHVDDLADEVDASDAQRAVFESTAQAILDDALAMKKAHKEDKKEMVAVFAAPTVDRDAVKAHIQEKIDQLEAFLLRSADRTIDAYESLDNSQRQILLDKLAEHMENH